MTTTVTPTMLIGLADVALLAKVQRPVVSVWRGRAGVPFPSPAGTTGGRELFDADELVEWLEATGRGNNPDVRADVAAFAALSGAPLTDEIVFNGVTALLSVYAVAGPLPDDADELLDLADETDPDDEYVYSEIEALGDRLSPLARYANLLVHAAYSPAPAFEKLMADRFRTPLAGHARVALTAPAAALAAGVARAVGIQAGFSSPVYVDPVAGSSDLLVALAAAAGDRDDIRVAMPASAGGRLTRRRLRVHGIACEPLPDVDGGGFQLPEESVLLMQLPTAERPGMSDLDMLRACNDIALSLTDRQRVVVIGPASALTDRLRPVAAGPGRPAQGSRRVSEAAQVRDDILRLRVARAIVRLPAGLVTRSPRQRLALWCLGPSTDPDAEATTVVGDLADTTRTDEVVEALITDVVAAMSGRTGLTAHVPHLTRQVFTRELLARDGDLVGPRPGRARPRATADLLARIDAQTAALCEPLPVMPTVSVRPSDTASTTRPTTITSALAAGALTTVPALRIEQATVGASGGVQVIGPEEIHTEEIHPEEIHAAGARRIDRLELAALHPNHQLTEPGDVVFCTAPHPAAVVDVEGGSVVAYPARALRCREPGIVAAVLAADIKRQPRHAKTWRAWRVRPVPPDQADAVAEILADLEYHRTRLTERVAGLDTLVALLLDGVTRGSVDLTPAD